MLYINVSYDADNPKKMAKVIQLWEKSTHASGETIPHILQQWREGKCYLRINSERLGSI